MYPIAIITVYFAFLITLIAQADSWSGRRSLPHYKKSLFTSLLLEIKRTFLQAEWSCPMAIILIAVFYYILFEVWLAHSLPHPHFANGESTLL